MKKIEIDFVTDEGKKGALIIRSTSLMLNIYDGLASNREVACKERDGNRFGTGITNFRKVIKLHKYLIDNKIKKLSYAEIRNLISKFKIELFNIG